MMRGERLRMVEAVCRPLSCSTQEIERRVLVLEDELRIRPFASRALVRTILIRLGSVPPSVG